VIHFAIIGPVTGLLSIHCQSFSKSMYWLTFIQLMRVLFIMCIVQMQRHLKCKDIYLL